MIRGVRAVGIAVRRPSGEIVSRVQPLRGVYTSPLRRIPGLRGMIVLWESLGLGMKALIWSAAVAANEVDHNGDATPVGFAGWAMLIGTLLLASVAFFAGPVLATAWLDSVLPAAWMAVMVEGVLRLAVLLGYIWAVGRSDDVRRLFQYHGAEHMTIAAFEAGHDLHVPGIRRYRKEHPRCGTSFLLTVALVAVLVFAFIGTEPLWWRFASRIVLMPLIAAVAYEVIRFAGFHHTRPVVRWIFSANLALQRLTTRPPDDEHIQVALAALECVRAEEKALVAAAR